MQHTFTVTMETDNDVCVREQLEGYLSDFLMEGADNVAEDTSYGKDTVPVVIRWQVKS